MQESTADTAEGPLVEAVLTASRVLVAISAKSLAGADEHVTLPQYRTLVVLQARGPQSLQQLSEDLQVVPSTATRMCDRLVRKQLMRRGAATDDRREVELAITPKGSAIVDAVIARRRAEISRIVGRMGAQGRADLVAALQQFAAAAGEVPHDEWFLGWA